MGMFPFPSPDWTTCGSEWCAGAQGDGGRPSQATAAGGVRGPCCRKLQRRQQVSHEAPSRPPLDPF
eukprot:1186224-Prorocentrum_minimum.AAC.2